MILFIYKIINFILYFIIYFSNNINNTEIVYNFLSINPITYAITGSLLGDGHLRFTHKDTNNKPTGNALLAFTFKSYDYTYYLWGQIYSSIVTKTPPRPWPNPQSGLPVQQYTFNTRALPLITELHNNWYSWSNDLGKFIKILPSNIFDVLNPMGLAIWIMDDGYWNNGVILCTDNFTNDEVKRLVEVLNLKFNLKTTMFNRNNNKCWRIRISGRPENILKLRELLKPYFIDSMLYKLGIKNID